MDKTPDYENYTDAQLQDARAHIDAERYPANFTALQNEMQRRSLYPPTLSTESGNVSWFYGWLIGIAVGFLVGNIIFFTQSAYLKFSSKNPYGSDDWGYGLIGIVLFSVLVCSFIGFIIGVKPRNRS